MTRKAIIITAAAVILIMAAIVFTPRFFVVYGDCVQGALISYRDTVVAVDNSDLKAVLSGYDARRSLGRYFPYQQAPDEIDIHLVRNGRGVHIILGAFNIWYESADKGACAIRHGQELRKQILDLIVQYSGTAYSRKMDGTAVNWRDTGCSYALDETGGVTLSYGGGKITVEAPPIAAADTAGFFLSAGKTAIAYGGKDGSGPLTILVSDDMGMTWTSSSIAPDNVPVTWNAVGFTSMNDGWLVTCSFVSEDRELHSVYKTSDGGKTWTSVKGNIYDRALSGAGAWCLCFRDGPDSQPAVYMMQNDSWSKLRIEIPEEYAGYNKTPLSPSFDGHDLIVPVLLTDGTKEIGTVYLKSNDYGATWRCEK
jgi:hypothetical protein